MGKKKPADLKHLRLDELEDQITELAGHLNAANYRWLTLIAEFDRRNGWCDGKLHSCAHWLNFKVGLNLGAAREKIRVAHALEGLPKIAASMARGELSYSKVRALTRIACGTTEDSLLMIALHGTAHHVEKLVRHYRQVEHAEELARETRQEERCRLSCWYDTDGSLIVQGRIPALKGAVFEKALEAAMEAVPATEPISPTAHPFDWDDPEEPSVALRPYGARRAEAYREKRPPCEWNAIHDVHEAQGLYIDARTATTRWAGERMDYDLAIFSLFSSVARARRVSAETSEPSPVFNPARAKIRVRVELPHQLAQTCAR